DGAGSFDVTSPMTMSFSFSYPPMGGCSARVSGAYIDSTLGLAGAYEEDDASLHLTRVELKSSAATGQLTATCEGRTVTCTLDTRRTPAVDCVSGQPRPPFSLPPLAGRAAG